MECSSNHKSRSYPETIAVGEERPGCGTGLSFEHSPDWWGSGLRRPVDGRSLEAAPGAGALAAKLTRQDSCSGQPACSRLTWEPVGMKNLMRYDPRVGRSLQSGSRLLAQSGGGQDTLLCDGSLQGFLCKVTTSTLECRRLWVWSCFLSGKRVDAGLKCKRG